MATHLICAPISQERCLQLSFHTRYMKLRLLHRQCCDTMPRLNPTLSSCGTKAQRAAKIIEGMLRESVHLKCNLYRFMYIIPLSRLQEMLKFCRKKVPRIRANWIFDQGSLYSGTQNNDEARRAHFTQCLCWRPHTWHYFSPSRSYLVKKSCTRSLHTAPRASIRSSHANMTAR